MPQFSAFTVDWDRGSCGDVLCALELNGYSSIVKNDTTGDLFELLLCCIKKEQQCVFYAFFFLTISAVLRQPWYLCYTPPPPPPPSFCLSKKGIQFQCKLLGKESFDPSNVFYTKCLTVSGSVLSKKFFVTTWILTNDIYIQMFWCLKCLSPLPPLELLIWFICVRPVWWPVVIKKYFLWGVQSNNLQ